MSSPRRRESSSIYKKQTTLIVAYWGGGKTLPWVKDSSIVVAGGSNADFGENLGLTMLKDCLEF